VIVVDASVIAPALTDDGADGRRVRERLQGERLAAPELIVLEVASVVRRAHRSGRIERQRAEQALADLRALPLGLASHRPLIGRVWELRDNASSYDAAYLALAEALDAPLLTGDARLTSVPGADCRVELIGA
jgi:predicted nucleic acid-binding protein